MIATTHAALWEKINGFSIDDPSAVIRFSDKLAQQNHWTKDYANRVIEEYKRFIFLSCISPAGASPSHAVDEAWHLHLTYTYNYWKIFCAEVLGQEIHHYPSKGGNEEKERHIDWYQQTLQFYKEVFDQAPPPDIWPAPHQTIRDTSLVRAGNMPDLQHFGPYLLVLLVPFLVPLMYHKPNPYQLTGPQFLSFFAVLALAGIVCLFLVYRHNQERVRQVIEVYYGSNANTFQLARYAFGIHRSIQTAIVDLVERTILEPGKYNAFTLHPERYRALPGEKNPIVNLLLQMYKEDDLITYQKLVNIYDKSMSFNDTLGLATRQIRWRHLWQYGIAVFIGVIGIARLFQGIQNGRPVAFLLAMMIGLAFIFGLIYKKINCRKIFQDQVREGFENKLLGDQITASSVASQFAFSGFSALGVSYLYSALPNTFMNERDYSSDSSFYTSCGSGSSCGSGDGSCGSGGGSCGGGGCGGCSGGGD